jgi:dihydroorotate dehydrogenase electron transfer subunit
MYELNVDVVRAERLDGAALITFGGLDPAFFTAFEPGMFANIRIPDAPDLLLRRPISIHSVNEADGEMTIYVQAVGEGTRRLVQIGEGTRVTLTAPLGHGFPAPECEAWLVGGGAGAAPLLAFAQKYQDDTAQVFLGFQSKNRAFSLDAFSGVAQLTLCTDDGSAGVKGFVTQALKSALERAQPAVIYACGPKPLLEALSAVLGGRAIPCYVSLEERMGCGVGACRVCACAIRDKNTGEKVYKRVCADGPVFPLSEVIL